MNPVQFVPVGPIEVPYVRTKKSFTMPLSSFWDEGPAEDWADRQGVYVLAVKSGKSLRPPYVGLTRDTFRREAFSVANCRKYRRALGHGKKHRVFLFLILQPEGKSHKAGKKKRADHISAVEDFFIRTA